LWVRYIVREGATSRSAIELFIALGSFPKSHPSSLTAVNIT
jgi:hypothetical protein